jgi:hypothetical protein
MEVGMFDWEAAEEVLYAISKEQVALLCRKP